MVLTIRWKLPFPAAHTMERRSRNMHRRHRAIHTAGKSAKFRRRNGLVRLETAKSLALNQNLSQAGGRYVLACLL
jgi:hypothetical protein